MVVASRNIDQSKSTSYLQILHFTQPLPWYPHHSNERTFLLYIDYNQKSQMSCITSSATRIPCGHEYGGYHVLVISGYCHDLTSSITFRLHSLYCCNSSIGHAFSPSQPTRVAIPYTTCNHHPRINSA